MAQMGAAVDPAFSQAGHTIASAHGATREQEAARTQAIAAKIQQLRDPNDPQKLTPLRAHYLKKQLVKLQVQNEMKHLAQRDALSTFGPPFKPSQQARNVDLPLARFVFHHFVLTFPFLRSAPPNFFSDKVQVFLDLFLERNISGTDDRDEETKRRKLTNKLENSATLLLSSAIQVGPEDVVRISDTDRARVLASQSRVKAALAGKPVEQNNLLFDVNVIGVRSVVTKGRLRHRQHEEFIIRTRRQDQPDVFVSRRYGDFQRLADTLRVEFPDEDISRPPAKDKAVLGMPTSPHHTARPDDSALDSARSSIDDTLASGADGLTIGRTPRNESVHLPPSVGSPSSSTGLASPPGVSGSRRSSTATGRRPSLASAPGHLAREKNRLTLRAYLRSLLANPPVADSPALADFLLGDPTTLTADEESDCRSREALDAIRADETLRFNAEAAQRVATLKGHLAEFKKDLVQKDGLSRMFGTIKATPRIEDLPESYKALLSWARISAASTLFHLFMGSDTSSDLFGQLKRIHGLMPYFMMRQVLRISNPVTMIRGVIDLFLAQPFGQRSLLQRMFSSSLQEEARDLQELVNAIKAKIEDETLCEKVRLFVYAPPDVQNVYKADAESEKVDLLTTILRSPEEPRLNRPQIHRVIKASRSYEVYKRYRSELRNPEDDEGPQDDDAWLYEDLHVLLRTMTRLRDKEQMLSLIFEGVTAELLKDIVTIFYSPLAQVYKAANIADSLYDLQTFINDLIKTVEANEELSYTDPQRTVQVFIDLVARHEGKFYTFVHQVHSKGAGLFDGLMHWVELFLNFVRTGESSQDSPSSEQAKDRRGLGHIDLEICLPAGGSDRAAVLAEIDALVVHAYRLKLLRELKLSRRIADREVKDAAQSASLGGKNSGLGVLGGGGSVEEDESAFFAAMVDSLGFSKGFEENVEDAGAEDDDSDEEEEQENEGHQGGSSSPERYDTSDEEEFVDSDSDAFVVPEESPEKPARPLRTASSGWRPPAPTRGDSVMTITGNQPVAVVEKDLPDLPSHDVGDAYDVATDEAAQGSGSRNVGRKRRNAKPQPPELKAIPEMVPLFVEMLRPKLRPARTASASSYRSASTSAAPSNNTTGNDTSDPSFAPPRVASPLSRPSSTGPPPTGENQGGGGQGWGSWVMGGFSSNGNRDQH